MKNLKIYTINDDYIQYLSQFENNIDYNKKNHEEHKRPYIGIVFIINDFNYFAPLKSPKKKNNINIKYNVDIILIDDGRLGVINLNDMIPIPQGNENITCEVSYIVDKDDNEDSIKYKNLIQSQIKWCNKKNNKEMIYKKARKLYDLYNKLPDDNRLKQRCCNFKLLEEKSIAWK